MPAHSTVFLTRRLASTPEEALEIVPKDSRIAEVRDIEDAFAELGHVGPNEVERGRTALLRTLIEGKTILARDWIDDLKFVATKTSPGHSGTDLRIISIDVSSTFSATPVAYVHKRQRSLVRN